MFEFLLEEGQNMLLLLVHLIFTPFDSYGIIRREFAVSA
jgi:hypothetical protein